MNPVRRRRLGTTAAFRPPQWGNLQLWLSADVGTFTDTGLTTPATADGTAVGGWRDRGPFAHHASQATAGKRPLLKTAGVNGHASLLFASASSQYLSADAAAPAFSGTNLPLTMIAVLQPVTTTATVYVAALANNALAAPFWTFGILTGPVWGSAKHDDTTHSTTRSGGTPDTNPHLLSWISSGTDLEIQVDGVDVVAPISLSVSPTTMNTYTVGALNTNGIQAGFVNAHIAELFLWSAQLSAGEQQAVRMAMAKKYGISSL